MSTTKKVLVTGGAGFIGSHLSRAWLAEGAKVTVLDSLRTGKRENLRGLDVEFIEGSVENKDMVRKAMAGASIVHHLAALVSVPESMQKPELTESINALGTINVLDAARECGVEKVVFSSTSAVYGMAEREMHCETDLPEPISPYAITKLAGEHYMSLYRTANGVPTVALRYFNVYGPGQDPESPYAAAIAIFTRRARANQPIVIYGDGNQTRDFVHVGDVVRANMLVAGTKTSEAVYNVACGTKITIRDLAEQIVKAAGSKSQIIHEAPRAGDVIHSKGNPEKLKALGWKPTISLADGLMETLAAN